MKCIYHNDMDGRCAGSLVAKHTGNYDSTSYIEADYKHFPINKIKEYETVFIVDYSFSPATIHYLDKIVHQLHCKVIWIDHHTSSIDICKTYAWANELLGIRSDKLCGAALTYIYFHNRFTVNTPLYMLPAYIQYVDDYDRWQYRLGDATIHFKLGIDTISHGPLDVIWASIENSSDACAGLMNYGAVIKSYIDSSNAEYLNSFGYESTISDLKCYVVNKRTNSWIFGDKINKYPIVATFVFDGDMYQYSLYSNNPNVNCAAIAESYGGGGHKVAAGFRCKELIFKKN